jgi:hypothetical protein
MDDLSGKPRVREMVLDVPCTDTPSERAEKLKAQMAEFLSPESAAQDAIVEALLADEKEARKRLADWEGTEPTKPDELELKEKRVAEAKAAVAALEYRIRAMRGDFSDDEEQARRAQIAKAEADDANESRVLQRRRQEVEALPAATLSELVAKREELNRIDGELHDLDGVLPSEHPNWAAAQLARIQSGNQPFEPIFSLHIGPDERLFAVGEVPALTARAEYSERYSGNETEMTTEQRVDRMMIEGLHRDKLMASVRSGHVTPYSSNLMHPSPRRWDPTPEAGYLLPIGELRKFAMLLLMEVCVKAAPVESDPPNELEPAAPASTPIDTPVPSWTVTKPERDDGLAWPLYRVLKAASEQGSPRLTAREVLDEFFRSKPREIQEVMADEVKYLDSNGDVASANLANIRKRIERMTER